MSHILSTCSLYVALNQYIKRYMKPPELCTLKSTKYLGNIVIISFTKFTYYYHLQPNHEVSQQEIYIFSSRDKRDKTIQTPKTKGESNHRAYPGH